MECFKQIWYNNITITIIKIFLFLIIYRKNRKEETNEGYKNNF